MANLLSKNEKGAILNESAVNVCSFPHGFKSAKQNGLHCWRPLCHFWWRFTDSNRGPVDYDSIALTD